jgi:sulfide:quinone oxidoreductase
MQPRKLTDGLSITSQITVADVATIKAAGFNSIICNRPDGEAFFGQPSFREIEVAATAAGLSVRYQPIHPGRMGESDAAAFAASLRDMPAPVLAYCRTGARSGALWSMCQANRLA